MSKNLALAAIVASLISTPGVVSAEGFYIGLSAGKADYDLSNIDFSEESSFAIKSGYQFNENFSLELSYNNLGRAEMSTHDSYGVVIYRDSYNVTESKSITVDNKSVSIAAMGIIPLSSFFSLHGKIGIERWESEIKREEKTGYTNSFDNGIIRETVTAHGATDEEGTDIFYGVGAGFAVSDSLKINLDYELHSWDENRNGIDIDNWSLGLQYNF